MVYRCDSASDHAGELTCSLAELELKVEAHIEEFRALRWRFDEMASGIGELTGQLAVQTAAADRVKELQGAIDELNKAVYNDLRMVIDWIRVHGETLTALIQRTSAEESVKPPSEHTYGERVVALNADPWLFNVLNGSKTMVFVGAHSGHYGNTYANYQTRLRAWIGLSITLNQRSLDGDVHVRRVLLKDVIDVDGLLTDLLNDAWTSTQCTGTSKCYLFNGEHKMYGWLNAHMRPVDVMDHIITKQFVYGWYIGRAGSCDKCASMTTSSKAFAYPINHTDRQDWRGFFLEVERLPEQ
jgi:hypothetical protein